MISNEYQHNCFGQRIYEGLKSSFLYTNSECLVIEISVLFSVRWLVARCQHIRGRALSAACANGKSQVE